MKCRVEHRYLRRIWQPVEGSFQPPHVGRIVERGKLEILPNDPYHFTIDLRALRDLFSAMHDTVPHGPNLIQSTQHAVSALAECVQHGAQAFPMVISVAFVLEVAVVAAESYGRSFLPNPVDVTASQRVLLRHLEKSALDG
jgi:hypothetical protein